MKLIKTVLPLLVPVLLVACGGSGGGSHMTPAVTSVSLSPDAPTLLVGASVTLTATPLDSSGKPLNGRTIQWSSRDMTVASVSSAGTVTAHKVGSTQITASVGSVAGQTRVDVTEAEPETGPVASVDISPTLVRTTEGEISQLFATPLDATGHELPGRGMHWSVLDPDIATVSPGGAVTALKSGSTRVDVTVEGKTASASILVESAYDHGLIYSQAVAVGASELFVLNINDPAGSEIPLVLPGPAKVDPTPSPDGSRIAFVMLFPTETAIYVANRDGTSGARLTTSPGTFDQPAWSPDGSLLAFRGRLPGQDSDIWVMAPDGSGALNLTASHGPTSQSSPAWSPQAINGKHRIAYSHSESGMGHLWTMSSDGTDKQQITSSTTAYDDMPSYSPDGNSIVFVRSAAAIFGDLYVVEASGGSGRALTPYTGPIAGPQLEPSWSPDGKLIAFASKHADEYYQIYTVWFDGTKIVRRTSDSSDHSSPSWIAL